MGRFRIPDHNEHLIVNVLVGNGIALRVPGCLCNDRVVVHLELTVGLFYDDHGLGVGVHVFWSGSDGHELNVIIDS